MINVRVAAATRAEFIWAVRVFLDRVKTVKASLGDVEMPDGTSLNPILATDDQLAAIGLRNAKQHTFLGEVHAVNQGVVTSWNTERHLSKLAEAHNRLNNILLGRSDAVATRRHVSSIIGACLWLAHTVAIDPTCMFRVIRLSSALARSAYSDNGS
jgi:hypothetical protein